jgi:hypothetical protein
MARKYYQGKFKPKNTKKYIGDVNNIEYRSSWELKCMNHFDTASYVYGWNSEGVIIPYISPKDTKYHRYFIDFLIVTKDKNGEKVVTLIEVKPEAQTVPPKSKGKKKSRFLQEAMTFDINIKKWEAARKYCEKKGWNFMIMTEKHIF